MTPGEMGWLGAYPLIYRDISQPLNQKDYLLNHFYINGNQTTICFFNLLAYLKY